MQEHSTIEYRDIPGFIGYKIGSDGSVWSRRRRGKGGLMDRWHRMTAFSTQRGYLAVGMLSATKKRPTQESVHRLLLLAFVGPPPEDMIGCHKNDDRQDNRLENLYWGTSKENTADALRNRRHPMGESSPKAKLTEKKVRIIKATDFTKRGSRTDLAKALNISPSAISDILAGRTWNWIE